MSDTFKRKAQTRLPNGVIVEREWTSHECYQLYCRGFKNGASGRCGKEDLAGLGPYDRGFADGLEAFIRASKAERDRLGIEPPSLLRYVTDKEGE